MILKFLALSALVAQAEPSELPALEQDIPQEEIDRICGLMGNASRAIYIGRQEGVSLAEALKVVAAIDPDVRPVYRLIVMDAYEKPAYSTDEIREQEANEFRNKWTLFCLTEIFDD